LRMRGEFSFAIALEDALAKALMHFAAVFFVAGES